LTHVAHFRKGRTHHVLLLDEIHPAVWVLEGGHLEHFRLVLGHAGILGYRQTDTKPIEVATLQETLLKLGNHEDVRKGEPLTYCTYMHLTAELKELFEVGWIRTSSVISTLQIRDRLKLLEETCPSKSLDS